MKVSKKICIAVALALGVASLNASAQSVAASNTTTSINTIDHVATVTISQASGPASLGSVDFTLGYVNAEIALPVGGDAIGGMSHPEITTSDTDVICIVNTVGTVACSGFGAIPLPFTVQIRFDAQGIVVPSPGSALTLGGVVLGDSGGATLTPSQILNGSVIINSEPAVQRTLSYSPVPGPLPAFGSGVIGSSASQNIVATATGNSGTASLACTATAGFTVTPSLNFAAAGSQNIAVGCTYAAAASNGSVTCTEIDGDTPSPGVARTWTATCPAGSVAPVNPTITTVTPTGAFAMPTGTIGQTVTRPIQFTAAGGAGSGSATIACTAPAPVTVAPANQTVTGSAQPQNVVVSLPLTSAAQGPFTVSCVITDSAGARTNTFDVTAAAGSAFVAPSVVPATSTWSMVALIALMAGFGIALVGFRRNH